MTYREEFPDFVPEDMPAIPAGFEDTSWHNDVCPSFTSDACGLTIWVDYPKSQDREFEESVRFSVAPQKDGIEVSGESLATDDWDEVLRFVVAHLARAAGYESTNTGGGCMAWEMPLPSGAYLWICDESNGLGDRVDETYLVGHYNVDGDTLDNDTVTDFQAALAWCRAKMGADQC